jgi:hypothetical protein
MAGDLIQTASWPGVIGTASCTYTCTHGVSPGTAVLMTIPQANTTDRPDEFGNLTIGDGFRRVVLQDCKIDRITSESTPEGTTWRLEIFDRRWRWRTPTASYGGVRGWYNRQDDHGKLVPWAIRSPYEMAKICLDDMGEVGYVIDLPKGLSRADGMDLDRYLRAGENFKQSFANPEQIWDHSPPALMLAALADFFGCRVVYQPFANRVVVTPLGVGLDIPGTLPTESFAPGIDTPETPREVGVAGAPTRFQGKFLLEAVGEEWDGSYLPIDDLSYAPRGPSQKQISTVTGSVDPPGHGVFVQVSWTDEAGNTTSILAFGEEADDLATQMTSIAAQLNAKQPGGQLSITSAGAVLTIEGTKPGFGFNVESGYVDGFMPNTTAVTLVQPATKGGGSWATCIPPTFLGVQATDRLSYIEALRLAKNTVFRCFRVVNRDPFSGTTPLGGALGLAIPKPLTVPGFGIIKRRQQLVLQPTKVEQVVPTPRIAGGIDRGNPLGGIVGGILPEYYNGYSRDQRATVTGRVAIFLPGLSVVWNPKPVVAAGQDARQSLNQRLNTGVGDRVFVGFNLTTVDSGDQLVVFSDYLYEWLPADNRAAFIRAPRLVIETATLVRDEETDQFVRGEWKKHLGGKASIEWAIRDDVVRDYIGLYGFGSYNPDDPINEQVNLLNGVKTYNEEDSKSRADYYLEGMARKFQNRVGGIVRMVGIYPLDPDGKIHQVTWETGPGATTIGSVDTEHSDVIPPYPRRRLQENLAPNADAAAANRREYEALKSAIERSGPAGFRK